MARHEAGLNVASDPYRRGVAFLLRSQHRDGSWHVRSRSQPTQIFFESGFPHGEDQFISAAATNWATQALIATVAQPDVAPRRPPLTRARRPARARPGE